MQPPTPPAPPEQIINGSSSAAHPWDLPSNRPLMPGDSLASIEKRASGGGPAASAGAPAAAPLPQSLLDRIFGRRRLRAFPSPAS